MCCDATLKFRQRFECTEYEVIDGGSEPMNAEECVKYEVLPTASPSVARVTAGAAELVAGCMYLQFLPSFKHDVVIRTAYPCQARVSGLTDPVRFVMSSSCQCTTFHAVSIRALRLACSLNTAIGT